MVPVNQVHVSFLMQFFTLSNPFRCYIGRLLVWIRSVVCALHPLQNYQRLSVIFPECKYHILSTNFHTSQSIWCGEQSLPEGPIDRLSMKLALGVKHPGSIITLLNYCTSFMFLCFEKVQFSPRERGEKKQETTFSASCERWPEDLIASNLFFTKMGLRVSHF